MEPRIIEIAQRIRGLREIFDLTQEQMAEKVHISAAQYRAYENGETDFGFTFLYSCAQVFEVDIVELLTGENPKLSFYTIVRSGNGLPMKRRKGFTYQHLAYRMKDKLSEPFLVTAPYSEDAQTQPIELSYHNGQEFNYILKGSLKVQLDDHIEVLGEGDAIYYDSGHGHGMIATGGNDCVFLAFVMKDQSRGDKTE